MDPFQQPVSTDQSPYFQIDSHVYNLQYKQFNTSYTNTVVYVNVLVHVLVHVYGIYMYIYRNMYIH